MSMLTRAAKRFDERFAAMPPEVQQAVALAMYRAAPSVAQYQKDLEPLGEDPEIVEAIWDLLVALGVKIGLKGRGAFSAKVLAELAEAAPTTAQFLHHVTKLVAGVLPLGVEVPALPAAPPTDAEIIASLPAVEK